MSKVTNLVALVAAGFVTASSASLHPAVRPADGDDRAPAVASGKPAPQRRSCDKPTVIATVDQSRVVARAAPRMDAAPKGTFERTNGEGSPQVFDVAGPYDPSSEWLKVLLPVRPNGTTGYVPADAVTLRQTPYRLLVDRAALTLTLFSGCRVVERFRIGLGTEDTPTPVGSFYLVSLVRPPIRGSIYGAYAYGLSAYSDVIFDWRGGGIIGLHGTNDPTSIGRRASHGCIRMLNEDITRLVRLLPLGTPIEIR